jgi:hypothetical protein
LTVLFDVIALMCAMTKFQLTEYDVSVLGFARWLCEGVLNQTDEEAVASSSLQHLSDLELLLFHKLQELRLTQRRQKG